MSFSYARAASLNIPSDFKPVAPVASKPTTTPPSPQEAKNAAVRNWLKGTGSANRAAVIEPIAPGRGVASYANRPRSASDPQVTQVRVIRKGKVYVSTPTPPGGMNARDRRRLRRAMERESKDGSEAQSPVDKKEPTSVEWNAIYDSSKSASSDTSQSLGGFVFPPPAPVPSPISDEGINYLGSRSGSPPSVNPFLLFKDGALKRPVPPPTPSLSGSSEGENPKAMSLPNHSRNASLNAKAAPFTPTAQRSPSNSGKSSSLTVQLQEQQKASPPAYEPESPESPSSADASVNRERRHSIAVAAWQMAQRRLSQQYDTPEYKSTNMWSVNGSPIAPFGAFVDAQPTPVSPLASPCQSVGSSSWFGAEGFAVPLAMPGLALAAPLELASPGLPIPSASTPTRYRSGSLKAYAAAYDSMYLAGEPAMFDDLRQPVFVSPTSSRRTSVGSDSAGSICSILAELGEDPFVDNLVDLTQLTRLDQGHKAPQLPRRMHERQRSRLSETFSTTTNTAQDDEWVYEAPSLTTSESSEGSCSSFTSPPRV